MLFNRNTIQNQPDVGIFRRLSPVSFIVGNDLPADHQSGKLRDIGFSPLQVTAYYTISHNNNPVGNIHDFF